MKYPTLALISLAVACGGSTLDPGPDTGGSAGAAGSAAGADSGSAGSGNVGGGGVGAVGGGGAGTGGGGASATCPEIKDEFNSVLPQTTSCSLVAGAKPCQKWVDTSINGCGYFKWGDESNSEALGKLQQLTKEWKTLDCEQVSTCALGGYGPTLPATCKDTGQGGSTGECVQTP